MEKFQIKTNCFNLSHTLECGQCFRWQKKWDIYFQILSDRVVKLQQKWSILEISSNKTENLKNTIINYFDLDLDYWKIENEISQIDENIQSAVKNTSWLRILNQNFFETVISYIISANNNIPRISKSINKISEKYGEKVDFDGEIFYLFPTISQLKNATIWELERCGVWYRSPYIIETAKNLCNCQNLINRDDETNIIRKQLLSLKWIWPKVADCILLFSLQKKESFPIDTRVEKVMKELYLPDYTWNNIKKEIQNYVQSHFWKYAWLIQEHLFYNKRMWRI